MKTLTPYCFLISKINKMHCRNCQPATQAQAIINTGKGGFMESAHCKHHACIQTYKSDSEIIHDFLQRETEREREQNSFKCLSYKCTTVRKCRLRYKIRTNSFSSVNYSQQVSINVNLMKKWSGISCTVERSGVLTGGQQFLCISKWINVCIWKYIFIILW